MCWQQMSLDLLKQSYVEGMKMHFALKRFRLIRLDDTEKESVNRPYHGLALYVKEYFDIQKVVKLQCK